MQRAKIISGILLMVSCAFASVAFAQPNAEESEIEVSAGYFRSIGSGSGTFNGDIGYGYFLSDDFEVGLRQGLNYQLNKDVSDVWLATTTPFVEYHLRDLVGSDGFIPFVGGLVGLVWNEDDTTGTAGPTAGFKCFMNESTYFVSRYRYEWFFEEIEDANEVFDSNHVITAGLGYQW